MSLLRYNLLLRRITDITNEQLEKLNIKCLLIDVDNTLSTHHGTVFIDGLYEWIEKMRKSGIELIIVSNSKKFRVEPIAARLSLPFVSLAMKPLTKGYRKGVKLSGEKKENCGIVGDQLFTDVLGANLYGIKSVLVRPQKEEDGVTFKIRRYFEKKILKENY